MKFKKGHPKPANSGRKKGVPPKNPKPDGMISRQHYGIAQAAFAKVAEATPTEFNAMIERADKSTSMHEMAAITLMSRVIKKGDTDAYDLVHRVCTGGFKPGQVPIRELTESMRAAYDRLTAICPDGNMTLNMVTKWHTETAAEFAGDPFASAEIARTAASLAEQANAREAHDLNRQNSIPVKAFNELLMANALAIQQVLANHPDLMQKFEDVWGPAVMRILPNAAPQNLPDPEPPKHTKKARQKTPSRQTKKRGT